MQYNNFFIATHNILLEYIRGDRARYVCYGNQTTHWHFHLTQLQAIKKKWNGIQNRILKQNMDGTLRLLLLALDQATKS